MQTQTLVPVLGHRERRTVGWYLGALAGRVALVCGLLLGRAQATIDSGMVLFKLGTGEKEALELVYLSTGRRIVVDDGLVKYAKFSPDGTRIALVKDTPKGVKRGITMDLDGSNQKELGFSTNDIHWCSNGYLYWWNMGVKRIPEGGGQIEQVWALDDSNWLPTPIPGVEVAERMADCSITGDGRWAVGTAKKRRDGVVGGYAMMAYDLVNMTAYSPAEPCQGAISTLGTRLTVGNGGHHTYRAFPLMQPFEVFSNGDTWSGCGLDRMCPADEGVVGMKQYLCDRYGVTDPGPFDCSTPRWCRADDDVVTLNAIPKGAYLPDTAFGAFVVEFAPGGWNSCSYTKVAEIDRRIEDYFPGEAEFSAAPFILTPLTMSFSVLEGAAQLPAPKAVTLTARNGFTGTPQVAGAPAWLSVAVAVVDGSTYSLSNALVGSSLPGEGTDSATVVVTPQDGASPLSYKVYLDVGPAPLPHISVLSPTAGAVYAVGDTLRVTYTTNESDFTGVVIHLTVDEGETYIKLNASEAAPAGSNMVLDYVIPASLFAGTTVQSIDRCQLLLTNYPTGYDTYSPLFTILQLPLASVHRPRTMAEGLRLRSAGAASGSVAFSVETRASATVSLLGIHGRRMQTWHVGPGRHILSVQGLAGGHYIVEGRRRDGGRSVLSVPVVAE